MTVLNAVQWDILRAALQTLQNDTNINIYALNDTFGNVDPIEWGINWAAMGTQTADATREFANALYNAVDIIEELNSLELNYSYENKGPAINTDEYHDYVWAIYKLFDYSLFDMIMDKLNELKG